jgi:topoisomerase IA-like protein
LAIGKQKVKLPKGTAAEELTLQECLALAGDMSLDRAHATKTKKKTSAGKTPSKTSAKTAGKTEGATKKNATSAKKSSASKTSANGAAKKTTIKKQSGDS